MRRVVGVTAIMALAVALCSVAARSASLALPAASPDLRTQLMLRLFGETSDSSAAYAAQYGDRASESPLRAAVLQIRPTDELAAFAPAVPSVDTFIVSRVPQGSGPGESLSSLAQSAAAGLWQTSGAQYSPPSVERQVPSTTVLPANALFTASYKPVAPAPSFSPGSGTVAFAPLVNPASAFSGEQNAQLQIGHMQFEGHGQTATTDTPQSALHDNAYNAGASFDLKTGKRTLNLNLSSSYEHLARNDSASFSTSTLGSTSAWQLPGTDAPFAVPNYADVNRFSLGAGVAVPVLRGLTLNVNYAAQRYTGGYGFLPGLMNLDTVNNSYGGQLTFDLPHTANTLSVSAYQNRYQDSVLPINGYTQIREDVNFTVKF
jgi:hypothetical protein